MTDMHHHGSDTTIVDDSSGPAMMLVVLVVLALVGFLIWLFAFSGIVFDRDGGGTNIRIEEQNNPQQNTNPGGGTQPQPQNT